MNGLKIKWIVRNVRKSSFPIVAIGASAGGLKAFEDLLSALPQEPGMGFVLVPHLAPQFKSHLAAILTRCTKLPVDEIRNGDRVLPNRIYILPPNRTLDIKKGVLRLSQRGPDRRNPIDKFFSALAVDQKEKAIGVLLSGAGSDGTAGLQAIKERGGATFAQDEHTAAHLSMPHSAVVSGCVDFVLAPAEIGERLGVGKVGGERRTGRSQADETLVKILGVLRAAKGVDFEPYKRNTLRRRIQRSMTLRRVRDPEKYLRLLKADPKEVERLFQDILIGVTTFFREPDSFRALKRTGYPRMLKGRPANAPIRIWVPGCSTGEEAYSHAMNLTEFLGDGSVSVPFQIFASDVNPAVIGKARAGRYSKKAVAGVSPERLRRFFVPAGDGYRIAPFIRDSCVFAVQNLVRDPPFTSVDLISCRNLLIYLGPALQEKALQIFQYSLKPAGMLMLGSSEAVCDFSGRFAPLDEHGRIFSVRAAAAKARLDFVQPVRPLETEVVVKGPHHDEPGAAVPAAEIFDLQGLLDGVMPARYIPNGVVVDAELEILRFLGNTSPYLRPAPGKPSLNLRRMAAGDLLLELRSAIQAAKGSASAVRKEIARVLPGSVAQNFHFEVFPIKAGRLNKEYFLVLFEEAVRAPRSRDVRAVVELKENLAVSGVHLKAIIDEQEAANARLRSSNESLLSSNEALQSVNEEFETTKEELQSTNEELQSTNEELTTSSEEVVRGNQILSLTNNDLSNLLANIDIPIVLLDLGLAVRRFTPAAEKLLGLSPDKIGRPIIDLTLPFRLANLKQLLQQVIKTGSVEKLEVQDELCRWYYLFIRPYRTYKSKSARSRTEGAVMAFVDITERKRTEKSVQRLATVVLDSNDAVIICDMKDRIIAWNKGAQRMYGYAEKEALGMSIRLLMPGNKRIKAEDLIRVSAAPIEIQRRTRTGLILDVLITVTVLRDEKGLPVEVATTERDITEHKRAERERKLSETNIKRLATVVLDSNDGVVICDLMGRISAWNKGAQKMYGYTEAEALAMNIQRLMPEKTRFDVRWLLKASAAPIEVQRRAKDGRLLDVQLTVTVLRDAKGRPAEFAKTERDITAFKRAERERKLSEHSVRRLAAVVRDSNDAVLVCDLEDRITAWNKGARKMYGYSEAEALGMNIRKIMPENKLIRARQLVQVSAAPIEIQRRARGGRILDVLITVTVLRDAKGEAVEVATTERDITEHKRAERELRRLHGRVISAQETERQRIARELHDGVGQILSGVKFRLQALPGQANLSGGAEAKIIKVGGFLDHAIAEIRRVSQNLMPAELVDLGLEPALLTLCREFKERSGVKVTVKAVPTAASPELALALFRIAQEALNNIGKHSKATLAVVALSHEDKALVLCVSDNGIGFKPASARPSSGRGIGLGNMRQRAESVGGSLEVQSARGAGTTLTVRVPLSGLGGKQP